MGLYDREYTQADYRSRHYGAPQTNISFPRITPVVKWLLIINVGVYLLKVVLFRAGAGIETPFETLFAVYPTSVLRALQLWRLVTYQFLHWDTLHVFVNMLCLYFMGPALERHWGSRRFLVFYLLCGAVGGLFYLLLVAVKFLEAGPMAGASGAILGMLAACAILFPHFVVFVIVFPVPIRIAAIAFTFFYVLNILTHAENAGGDAAHLAGMAAGAAYVFSQPWQEKLGLRLRSSALRRKEQSQQQLQIELDRILEKVHDQGLHSLSLKEKRTLRKATKAEQKRCGL
jgi:membrane associated rhomboid family serine protease